MTSLFRMNAGSPGFTLIELLVVMTILALATALVSTAWRASAERIGTREAASAVASALNNARNDALRWNRPREISMDRLTKDPRLTGVKIEASAPRVRFAPNGSSDGAAIMIVGAGASYRIEVDWLTGAVAVANP